VQDLIAQERFEMAVLETLHSARLLPRLVFTGGTMLRLCHGLGRYSVDLDFWTPPRTAPIRLFAALHRALADRYTIRDAANKRFTLLFELRSPEAPRALKVEVRKDVPRVHTEPALAFSVHWPRQVLVTSVALPDFMRRKADAFLARREIRDAFDMEHMLRRGVPLTEPPARARALLAALESLARADYTVKLGSLLEPALRRYYVRENFVLLAGTLREIAATNRRG
jgi:predicted nucleotidyltransferase component of viral defense system